MTKLRSKKGSRASLKSGNYPDWQRLWKLDCCKTLGKTHMVNYCIYSQAWTCQYREKLNSTSLDDQEIGNLLFKDVGDFEIWKKWQMQFLGGRLVREHQPSDVITPGWHAQSGVVFFDTFDQVKTTTFSVFFR